MPSKSAPPAPNARARGSFTSAPPTRGPAGSAKSSATARARVLGALNARAPAEARPALEAPRRQRHVRRAAGVAQAQKSATARGIEVDARRRRHADVRQHGAGKGNAVAAELGNVDVEVKGPI